MSKVSKSVILFTLATFLLSGFLAYLGFRTVEHEALLRHYQTQTLAQSRIAQASSYILDTLNQKAVRITSMADFIQFDEEALHELIAKDSDIDAMFILQRNNLRYPNEQSLLSQRDREWIQAITPIIHDPSLLYSHTFVGEQQNIPQSGWFITSDINNPMLLYWIRQNDKTLGFKVSYIKLIFDVVNGLDVDFLPDILTVKDNDKLLYQSAGVELSSQQSLIESRRLPYPLATWQIDYYATAVNNTLLYMWGSLFILLLVIVVGLVMLRIYREYTQTAHLARQQVNFVGQVSHELKTPLTNITLYAEMLKEQQSERETDESTVHYLDVITSESQRLARLIQNILSFTKASKVCLRREDLTSLMNNITRTFIPAFSSKGMTINLRVPDNLMIETDGDRLTQIISNFLSNAEKYASSGKHVDLTVEVMPEKNTLSIQVRDYGNGIATKELKTIFQPFYRVKSDITEGVSGTGIGLTIAKQLAQSLGGDISVENCSPGVRFTLTLPYLSCGRENDENFDC